MRLFTRHLQAVISPFSMVVVLGLLVPIIALLWFMLRSVDNEREVVHSKLVELYRTDIQRQISLWLEEWLSAIEKAELLVSKEAPWSVFQQLAENGRFSTVVIMDDNEKPIYPVSIESQLEYLSRPAQVLRAEQLEFGEKNYLAARDSYLELANVLPNNALKIHLLAAAARCDWRAGNMQAAVEGYLAIARIDRIEHNTQFDTELITALVRGLELLTNPANERNVSKEWNTLFDQVQVYLSDYGTVSIGSRKRLFMQSKVRELAAEKGRSVLWPVYMFESRANNLIDGNHLDEMWQVLDEGADSITLVQLQGKEKRHRLRYFVDAQFLERNLQNRLNALFGAHSARIELANRPHPTHQNSLLYQRLSPPLQDVFITVSWLDDQLLNRSVSNRATAYIITGWTVIGFLCLSAIFIYRHFQKQNRLAKLKNDAISTIAHELKTPLTSVRILLDNLIDKRATADQQTREYIEIISQEHDRLTSLVDNFLTFSRLERGRFASYCELLDVKVLVQEALHLVETKFQQFGMQVEVVMDEGVIFVQADKSLMLTVLLNLLDNACKYSRVNRFVGVTVKKQAQFAEIEISDKGIGLSKKHLSRIFEQYYRVDPHLNCTTEGCGLGLHIARKIVLAHEGEISVRSTLGEGSVFTIQLPITAEDVNGR